MSIRFRFRFFATLALALAVPFVAQTARANAQAAASPAPIPTSSPAPDPSGSPLPLPTGSPLPLPTGSSVPLPTGSPVPAPTGSIAPQPTAATGALSPATALQALGASLSGASSGPAPAQYAQFVRKTERESGLIDTIKKDDDVYFDLTDAQFDRPYIIAPVLASGVGSEAFAGRIYPTFVMEFKRVGRRVLWVQKNEDFTAPPDSSAANALAISVTDSVINSTPIVAEDGVTGHYVVAASFFTTDFENVGKDLSGGSGSPILLLVGLGKPAFTVDSSKSYIERTKAFPKNDEILASLAFTGPAGQAGAAPDGRGVRIRMHYSIVDPPRTSTYVPRFADDRVGYFVTSQKRFDDDNLPSPTIRYIDRWNFNDGPIVYYLTNEIPSEYKPAIRQALLSWNAAFAKVGIPNAVEVRDQPSDPTWDPDDIRYSTVRWITSDVSPFAAYGPSVSDPRTGQIFRVEIVIDGEALRSVKRGYMNRVSLTRTIEQNAAGIPQATARASELCSQSADCDDYEEGSALSASVAMTLLRAQGATPAQTQKFADGWLEAVVLHESGHNFGLRHNFAASTLYSLAQLHDKHFTQTHGIVGSVMEYTPTNVSPIGQPQGDYFQSRLGPYDYWAIRYGYARFPHARTPSDEAIALHRIAEESTRREYTFATDQDANGFLAIDPRVATFDLSSDPLAYDASSFQLIDQLVGRLDRAYPSTDQPFSQERATFESMLVAYDRAALLAAKYVGGVYTSRDHRGQPGAKMPLDVVPYADSRRAFSLLSDNIFSDKAFHFSPELIAQLGANHFLDRTSDVERPDFAVSDTVGDLQDSVMYALFAPTVMSRLANAPYYAKRGERTMKLDELFDWMQTSVWGDLQPNTTAIDAIHRGLQRRYTHLLIAYTLAPSFLVEAIGYPTDTVPLATYELRRLDERIGRALHGTHLDVATRAHLEDIHVRVSSALHASATRGA